MGTESLTKVKEETMKVKNKIKNLGPVNINAVEELLKESFQRTLRIYAGNSMKIISMCSKKHLTGLMEECDAPSV